MLGKSSDSLGRLSAKHCNMKGQRGWKVSLSSPNLYLYLESNRTEEKKKKKMKPLLVCLLLKSPSVTCVQKNELLLIKMLL